jgi:predicted RNA-binding protein YlqC (UPF0109 family)
MTGSVVQSDIIRRRRTVEAAKKMEQKPDPYTELETMLRTMASMIVDIPADVVVHVAANQKEKFVAYQVICNERDAGALVGRRGKHAEAMRQLLMAAGMVRGIHVNVQFMSRDQYGLPSR